MPLSEIKKIQRRSKQAERDVGKWLLQADGPDPLWMRVATSTGRTGHLTSLQFDTVSLHYCCEVKNIIMTTKLQGFWQQIQEVAAKHGKSPLLVIKPSNPIGKTKDATWHVITELRHQELLEKEREHDRVKSRRGSQGSSIVS